MKIQLTWLNCFLLILPLLAWNLALGGRIADPRVTSDANSPKWLLAAENITRIVVFSFPLLLPLQGKGHLEHGWAGRLRDRNARLLCPPWLPLLLAPGSAWSSNAGRSAGPTNHNSVPVFPGHCHDRSFLALWGYIRCVHIHSYLAWYTEFMTKIPGFCWGFFIIASRMIISLQAE